MKIITKFKAIDGTEFDSELECIDYELLVAKVDQAISPLKNRPKDFPENGYIQHDLNVLRFVKIAILELISTKIKHEWIRQNIEDLNIHTSRVGRLLDECKIKAFNCAWFRVSCIDELGREYQQPYYVANSSELEDLYEIK